MLAAAGAKGLSRDRVLSVLWAESDSERARHALSQTVYGLHRALGAEIVLSTPELRLDSQRISSDVDAFRAAVRDKRWSDAAALYAGPFLDGFYLAEAPDFERWTETERTALSSEGIRAISAVATESSKRGDAAAAEHWRRLTLLDPLNPRFAASYMEALAAQGNRTAALAHGKAHGALLRGEFEAEPDPRVERLMARLRTPAPLVISSEHVALKTEGTPSTQPPARRPRAMAGAGLVALLAITGFIGWRSARAREPRGPVLAVGTIRDLVAPESASVGAVLSEMLATSLGRISDLRVIANSRMLELTPRGADTSRTARADAARRAGATELIEGELLPIADRRLRLEIRRVDLRRGVVQRGYRLIGDDRIALFDSVTNLIAGDFRMQAPTGSLGEVSTRSPIAYRFYEEGLRAFYQFDPAAAKRLFDAAIRDDSTFAMAAYYGWRAAVLLADSSAARLSQLSLRMAPRAALRDRLLIITHVSWSLNEPRALPTGDSLAALYPNDPEALIRSAEVTRGLASAVRLLNQSIAIDSAASISPSALCRMCEAMHQLADRYRWADSMPEAERTLRRWITLRPSDFMPWGVLADLYFGMGRPAAADAATRRYDALGGSRSQLQRDDLFHRIQADDLDRALTSCHDGLVDSDRATFIEYRWLCTIALRAAGRYQDARALNQEGRVPGTSVVRRNVGVDDFHAALLDLEMGHPGLAVDRFRGMYHLGADSLRVAAGVRARVTTWALTLSATAAVAAGDTARARLLADSIEIVGRRSLYQRDPVLHHFIRGLLLARAGHAEAAVSEYRSAIWSPTYGYTRVNLELGNTLLALGRPSEGIGVVRAALHGGIDGSNLYVTRTELHELLARLFDAAQQRDSATAHYAVVERAWRHADPSFQARYNAAAQRARTIP